MGEPAIASIPPGKIRLTYDEYVDLPDDGKRYEIIDGELFVTPAPVTRHQKISRQLQYILMAALEKEGKGEVYNAPVDVVLSRENVVQPDLLFVRVERRKIIGERYIEAAPDLMVEILSPGTRRRDVLTKSALYARFGVPSYWVVDPDLDRIEFYRLENGTYRLDCTVSSPEVAEPPEFPGLRIPLAEVFA